VAEIVRTVQVTLRVDTNKQTYERQIAWQLEETLEDFQQRLVETLKQLTEVS
jgi:hypothetical protein